jgi:quinol monooxygenase YgiN
MATMSSATPTVDARKTKVLARFTADNVTSEQYDETLSRLEKSGDWLPEGLEYHVAFRSNGSFRVSEIWDSREQLDAHAERLMPVLKDVGIELSDEPEMLEIHNIVKR